MIKYECDICGELNVPADTYGPGVLLADGIEEAGRGKPMVWWEDKDDIHTHYLSVMPSTDLPGSHVCGSCINTMLLQMIEEKWPEPYVEGTAEGATSYVAVKHGDGIFYPHFPGVECRHSGCPTNNLRVELTEEVNHDDVPERDGADTDVREVRAEREVQGASTAVQLSQLCVCHEDDEAWRRCPVHRLDPVRRPRGGPGEG